MLSIYIMIQDSTISKLKVMMWIVKDIFKEIKSHKFAEVSHYCTLISLINVEARLLILRKKSTLHAHFHPPRLMIS